MHDGDYYDEDLIIGEVYAKISVSVPIIGQQALIKDYTAWMKHQQKLEEAQLPIIEGEAPLPPVLPEPASYASTAAPSPYPHRSNGEVNLGSSQSHLSGVSKAHSRSQDDPNREYKI